jgi:hypothetical protein
MSTSRLILGVFLAAALTACGGSESIATSATAADQAAAGQAAAPRLAAARTANVPQDPWVEPQDTHAAITTPHLYAWRLFVALNWPANPAMREADPKRKFGENAITVWESWKLASGTGDEVFLNGGRDPGDWLGGAPRGVKRLQDLESLPLQQQIRRRRMAPMFRFDPQSAATQRNENHMNRASYEFIRSQELYNIEGQEAVFAEAMKRRDAAREAFDNSDPQVVPGEAVLNPKLIDFPLASKEIKAQWREILESEKPRYRWEEVDTPQGKKVFGLTAIHITTKDLPNWFWTTFEHVDNPKSHPHRPPAEGWLLPSNDPSAGPDGFPPGLGIEGTFWSNYRLRGIQIDFVEPNGKPTRLANSQIEEGFQFSSSCITCHARATIGARLGGAANRLSIFQDQFPDTNPLGEIGAPDNGLYERKTFDDPVIGQRLYVQTDFVWALMRAKRKR